jgi:hypothetical protein
MKRGKWHLTLWEIILILGSVPVFRSVWMVCDRVEFMNQCAGILLSFAGGMALCVMALLALNKTEKEQRADSCHDNAR